MLVYDALIVGGGPAGLSAALLLGRCRRKVLVCDAGRPRNTASRALHGYLTRDGIPPLELRRLGREELRRYRVAVRRTMVTSIRRTKDRFVAGLANGDREEALFVVLATGVVDFLPPIEGFRPLYGKGVFHCPYCDGWEQKDRRLAAYGRGAAGAALAVSLRTWSREVVLLTDGAARLQPASARRLERHGIEVRRERIRRLVGDDRLRRVEFRQGPALDMDALFFQGGKVQRSPLCKALGCTFTRKGAVRVLKAERAGPAGLFVIGDASAGIQMAIAAAADGIRAAVAINQAINQRMFP